MEPFFSSLKDFWDNVEQPTECWLWRGRIDKKTGYGRFSLCGVVYSAHRIAYMETKGPIGEGLQIDHLCRNRACINPSHLEAVTPRENNLRGIGPAAKNSRKTHCKKGHEFTKESTRWSKGERICRQCAREYQIKWKEKRAILKIQAPKALRSSCKNGHAMTQDNTKFYGEKRTCKECKRNRDAEARHRKAAQKQGSGQYSRPAKRVENTLCKRGHLITAGNIDHHKGQIKCSQCRRLNANRRYQEKHQCSTR